MLKDKWKPGGNLASGDLLCFVFVLLCVWYKVCLLAGEVKLCVCVCVCEAQSDPPGLALRLRSCASPCGSSGSSRSCVCVDLGANWTRPSSSDVLFAILYVCVMWLLLSVDFCFSCLEINQAVGCEGVLAYNESGF